MMFRIITYSILGFCLAFVFSPLLTMSGTGILSLATIGAVCGLALGMYLNHVVTSQEHFDIEGMISYADGRLPWALLPRRTREALFMWLRTKFKDDQDHAI
jgi:hypothetical protein